MGTKILIVEDEAIAAAAISERLQRLGYEVVDSVTSSDEALQRAAETQPDLILMDIVLGRSGVDGIETATRIQARFHIPIVYLTAHSDAATWQRAKLTAPFGYIIKPFTPEELQIAIEMALHKHQLERQLHQQKERFAALLEAISDAVVTTDTAGKVTYVNSAAEMLAGWSVEEALDKDATEVIPLVDDITQLPADHPVLKALKEGKLTFVDDHTILVSRKDRTETPTGDTATPPPIEGEPIEGVAFIFRNKRKPQKYHMFDPKHFGAGESQPPIYVYQNFFREPYKPTARMIELEKLRERLIQLISHEYRTPLTTIQLSSEMLRRYGAEWSNERREVHFQRIHQGVRRLTDLVDDVLTFKQLEAGEMPFEPALLDVEGFCREIIDTPQLTEGDRREFVFAYEGNPTAYLDRNLVQQILIQLLGNAIKYSNDSDWISLCVRVTDDDATFEIRDRGIGIPLEDQNLLYSTFFRASNIGQIPGTGMGLSVVKKCVELHQGEVRFESIEGEGTTFIVRLPSLPPLA